jgi:ectoine hydroxylase-related dioxygenase (phytanoyl-CoA dioxygenase family)
MDFWLKDAPWIDQEGEDIERLIESSLDPSLSHLREKLRFWHKNGYVVFEQVVQHSLIDDFLDEIEHLRQISAYVIPIELSGRQTWSTTLRAEEIRAPGVKFNHLHISSFHAGRLSLAAPVQEFLRAIFRAPPVALQSLTFWKGSQQPTHIDYPYVRMQRRLPYLAASWIPLEDVHPDAGPLEYFPGAHRTGVTGFFDWGGGEITPQPEKATKNGTQFASYLDEKLESASIQPVVFCPKKGDILVWHANMPHRGTRIRNDELTRKSYVTHYTGFDDYPARWLLPDDQLKSRSIAENGGFVFDFPWSSPKSKLPSWISNLGAPPNKNQ